MSLRLMQEHAMRFLLLVVALGQFACVAHYRFSADETKRLAGFDAHDESGDSAKAYRLIHQSGRSIEFDSDTKLAFALRDGTTTETSKWRSIQIEGDKWVAAPMDESTQKVSVPLAALDGSVAEMKAPGRTGALVAGLLGGTGAILLLAGAARSSADGRSAGEVPIVVGAMCLSTGVAFLVGSVITGWHLKADN